MLVFIVKDIGYFPQPANESFIVSHFYGFDCEVVGASFLFFVPLMPGWVVMLGLWVWSVYRVWKHQAVCVHKLIFYLAGLKAVLDFCFWLRMLICSDYWDPVLLGLIKSSLSTIYQTLLSALIVAICSVL
jgi:hypothetical protein